MVDREEVVTTDAAGLAAAAAQDAGKPTEKIDALPSINELETLKLSGPVVSAPETVKLDRAQVQQAQIELAGLRKDKAPRVTVALDIEPEKQPAEPEKTDGTAKPPESDSKK